MRVAVFLAVVTAAGLLLREVAARFHSGHEPAGFGQGVVHGALMPCELPTLLLGHDVPIYAASNSGRGYKIGYILGLDLCGLVFFGLLFRRLHRWTRIP